MPRASAKKNSKSGTLSIRPTARVINEQAEMVFVTLLRTHPRNARQGDIGAVYQSIAVNGFYGYLVVQKSTSYILSGNHRYLAACQLGFDELPVVWVDVDDEEALRILLADNRTSDLATYDDVKLAEMLADLSNTSEIKLEGTGYDESFLDDLVANLAASATEPPPKIKGEDRYAVVLLFDDDGSRDAAYEAVDALKLQGTYPRKTILNERTTLAVG